MIRKLLSIFLAIILSGSNIGLKYATHYCGGHKVNSGLNIDISNLTCGMEDQTGDCAGSGLEIKANCCQDFFTTLHTGPVTKDCSVSLTINDLKTECVYLNLFVPDFKPTTRELNVYTLGSPPLIKPDLGLLYEVFLI
ncbi:MAG: hypothetical protein H6605_01715 [Flavobacteriales bacterium]|nr:hypothetical protein [Flavobacteriales bacterium]